MKFEDAIKEVVDGKEVERSDGGSDLVIMYLSDNEIQFKSQSGIILGQAVTRPDLTADWCVVEGKPFNLSDKIDSFYGQHFYKEADIQKFINILKENVKKTGLNKFNKMIDDCAGGRFK